MGLEKLGFSLTSKTASYLKGVGRSDVSQSKLISGLDLQDLKYTESIPEDVAQISSSTGPIDIIHNFRQRFGQFMADYRCAFMAKHEFQAFTQKYGLSPDFLLRDMQRYKNVGQNTTSRVEEILLKIKNGMLSANEKKDLINEFKVLCEDTLDKEGLFHTLKAKLNQIYSDYSDTLDKSKIKRGLRPPMDIENPSELVRKPANLSEMLPKAYVENSRDVRMYFNNSIDNGSYIDSYESYVGTMNNAHKLAYSGKSGKNLYYQKNGQPYIMDAGKWRNIELKHKREVGHYDFDGESVENIAKKYNDPLGDILDMGEVSKTSLVRLKGIPEEYLPCDKWVCEDFEGFKSLDYLGHSYPPVESLDIYHKQMYRTAKEAIFRIKNGEAEERILEILAEHFQYAANARPYSQINNSLYMNEINTLLQRVGMNVMPHGNLDIIAQRLQPETFKRYFIDVYHKTSIPNLNMDSQTFATLKC